MVPRAGIIVRTTIGQLLAIQINSKLLLWVCLGFFCFLICALVNTSKAFLEVCPLYIFFHKSCAFVSFYRFKKASKESEVLLKLTCFSLDPVYSPLDGLMYVNPLLCSFSIKYKVVFPCSARSRCTVCSWMHFPLQSSLAYWLW